jgi:diguanylate cyclase (GGDEF)-like protein
LLGVHPNTVRAWTSQGRLNCLRINERGDRRYLPADLEQFIATARMSPPAGAPTDFEILAETARLVVDQDDVRGALPTIAELLCRSAGYSAAALVDQGGALTQLVGTVDGQASLVRRARRHGRPVRSDPAVPGTPRAAVPLAIDDGAISVLLLERGSGLLIANADLAMLGALAAQVAAATSAGARRRVAERRRDQAELLLAIRGDLAAERDVGRMLDRLLDRVSELFGVDQAAVLRPMPGVEFGLANDAGLEGPLRDVLRDAPEQPAVTRALAAGRVVSLPGVASGRRPTEFEQRLRLAGVSSLTICPVTTHGETVAALLLCHAGKHSWQPDDMLLLRELTSQAADVVRNARNYGQMATWAAQLESIQQLGTRLNRLNTVVEIGHAIAAELDQLINCHNVRVYRIAGDDVLPIAWRGRVGEYEGENSDMLRINIGQGITGWVARHGVAQNVPDASHDPRAQTIPGTDPGLDESLLLAPMLYEDVVLGVIVLAKLDLHQFSADDLRLLEIYASIAAQAMANADSTEELQAKSEAVARQLKSQRELLRVTESILGTLETPTLLEEISVRLDALMSSDSICVDIHDEAAHLIRPLFARGVNAARFLSRTMSADEGAGGHVIHTGEALLIQDMLRDNRVLHFDETAPEAGALILVPLRARDRVTGILTIERLGDDAHFTDEEFELVKLFGAHVSIALHNARAHRAVEIRAETDSLTGLWNQGALGQHLARTIESGDEFSLLMIDLDRFKKYNDRHGHQAGNEALRRLAIALRKAGRHSDEVFRYGGDEFAILLPATPAERAHTVARKVLGAVQSLGRDGTRLNCSIGVASYPADGADPDTIVLAADRACYAAKRSGGGQVRSAADGLALAPEFQLVAPTPVDPPEVYPEV